MAQNEQADGMLRLVDVAEVTGLSEPSVRTYHSDAARRRRQGRSRPQDMPEPDVVLGPWPRWKPETITEWVRQREIAAEENAERLRQPRGPRSAA